MLLTNPSEIRRKSLNRVSPGRSKAVRARDAQPRDLGDADHQTDRSGPGQFGRAGHGAGQDLTCRIRHGRRHPASQRSTRIHRKRGYLLDFDLTKKRTKSSLAFAQCFA